MIKEYNGQFGCLVVDFDNKQVLEDSLDREAIWEEACHSYDLQQEIYSEIIDDLLWPNEDETAPPKRAGDYWAGEATDFGFRAILKDGSIFQVDAEGSFFSEAL